MPFRTYRDQVQRISESVRIDGRGCWNWRWSKDRLGYGKATVVEDGKKKVRAAHRFAYSVLVGAIPKGMSILHQCDNRACVNPAHLRLGTQRDNVLDMYVKGRWRRHAPIASEANGKKDQR